LHQSPLVDSVLAIDKALYDDPWALLHAPAHLWPLVGHWRRLRAGRYDAVLLMHHLTLPFGRLKYRLLLQALRPAMRVGLDNGYGSFLDVRVPDAGFGARHEAEYCVDLVAALGATVARPVVGPSVADLGWADPSDARSPAALPIWREGDSRHSLDGPLVAMHLGSGSYSLARRWPLESYLALAHALHHEHGARLVLVGGPDDAGLQVRLCEALGWPGWVTDTAGTLDLRGLAGLLARCALFIGNDSLPMHLAAAAGTPVVAIFGPSNHRAWGPLPRDPGAFTAVVRRGLPCSPCFYCGHALGTPAGCPPRPCLTGLDVAPVLAAARRALARPAALAGSLP
jgi:heptosyltransferase-2